MTDPLVFAIEVGEGQATLLEAVGLALGLAAVVIVLRYGSALAAFGRVLFKRGRR